MDPVSVILVIGSISSAILAVGALSATIFKRPKNWIKKWVQNVNKEQLDEQLTPINNKIEDLIKRAEKSEEAEKTRLGHSIMTIYDRSVVRGYITLADRKDLIELHLAYKERNGNHHVDEYYEILMNMEVRE